MTQMALFHGQLEALDHKAETAQKADAAGALARIVFVTVLGAAYVVAALAAFLPVYVWLD
jgi:hypothetical protein